MKLTASSRATMQCKYFSSYYIFLFRFSFIVNTKLEYTLQMLASIQDKNARTNLTTSY